MEAGAAHLLRISSIFSYVSRRSQVKMDLVTRSLPLDQRPRPPIFAYANEAPRSLIRRLGNEVREPVGKGLKK